MKKIAALSVAVVLASGCAGVDQNGLGYGGNYGYKSGLGAVGGGAVSGLACSQLGGGNGKIAITAACTLLGGFAGYFVGKGLDDQDQYAAQARAQALSAPTGSVVKWHNPETGSSGSFTPQRVGTHAETGAYCREYQSVARINGKQQKTYGQACQQPDGSWEIVG